jgi:hypothetical protein
MSRNEGFQRWHGIVMKVGKKGNGILAFLEKERRLKI